MTHPNRRSLASRVYRVALRPYARVLVAPCLILGLGGASGALFAAGPQLPDPAGQLVTLAAILLMAGALGFIGLIGGISRWVARPAALEAAARAMENHVAMGAGAHPSLLPRDEWDRNHREVLAKLTELNGSFRELIGQLKGQGK